jgi:hypothetical protein
MKAKQQRGRAAGAPFNSQSWTLDEERALVHFEIIQ